MINVISMENFETVKELIADAQADAKKPYENANAAAGTSLRKGMRDLKNLAQSIRAEVTEKKNAKSLTTAFAVWGNQKAP